MQGLSAHWEGVWAADPRVVGAHPRARASWARVQGCCGCSTWWPLPYASRAFVGAKPGGPCHVCSFYRTFVSSRMHPLQRLVGWTLHVRNHVSRCAARALPPEDPAAQHTCLPGTRLPARRTPARSAHLPAGWLTGCHAWAARSRGGPSSWPSQSSLGGPRASIACCWWTRAGTCMCRASSPRRVSTPPRWLGWGAGSTAGCCGCCTQHAWALRSHVSTRPSPDPARRPPPARGHAEQRCPYLAAPPSAAGGGLVPWLEEYARRLQVRYSSPPSCMGTLGGEGGGNFNSVQCALSRGCRRVWGLHALQTA